MSEDRIRFDDGAEYEHMMGIWSRLVGEEFLSWLAPAPGQSWIDVGCGNGAFTELLVERCAPTGILGIDPSEGQLRFARSRHTAGIARFEQGNALKLPSDDRSFDAAVMALVIFFVPDPALGVAEMKRAVKPGGSVSAYAWDMMEPGGFPLDPMRQALRAMGIQPVLPPKAEVSRMDALQALWNDAGLVDIATSAITVSRTFRHFEDFWGAVETALVASQLARTMEPDTKATLKSRLRTGLSADASGQITYSARANAVTGRVPN